MSSYIAHIRDYEDMVQHIKTYLQKYPKIFNTPEPLENLGSIIYYFEKMGAGIKGNCTLPKHPTHSDLNLNIEYRNSETRYSPQSPLRAKDYIFFDCMDWPLDSVFRIKNAYIRFHKSKTAYAIKGSTWGCKHDMLLLPFMITDSQMYMCIDIAENSKGHIYLLDHDLSSVICYALDFQQFFLKKIKYT